MTQTPAGWYPDPAPDASGPGLRYWDGAAWTVHVAPAVAQVAPTGPTTPDGEPLAGWWWRVLAYVIDSFIVGIGTSVFSIPAQIKVFQELQPVIERFARQVAENPESQPDVFAFYSEYLDVLQANAFWLLVPTAVLTLAYRAILLRWKGATVGQLVLGLRVRLRERPGTLPWSSIAARLALQFGVAWIPGFVAFASGSLTLFAGAMLLGLISLLDPLWATWDPKRQTLHDKLARTNVVRTR